MIFETFARRKRTQIQNGEPEVYTYDPAPSHMRHQICLALLEGIGKYHQFTGDEFNVPPNANTMWEEMDRICRKELPSYLDHTQERHLSITL